MFILIWQVSLLQSGVFGSRVSSFRSLSPPSESLPCLLLPYMLKKNKPEKIALFVSIAPTEWGIRIQSLTSGLLDPHLSRYTPFYYLICLI